MDFTNRIIAFFDGSDLKIIHCEEEVKNKLAVRSDRGKQFRIPVKNVLLDLEAGTYETYSSKHDLIVAKIEEKRQEVDTELLWEMIAGEEHDLSLNELAEHYYGDDDKLAACALFIALVEDFIRFKRKGITFLPRTAEQVEEQELILKRKREKEEFKARVIPWLEASLQQKSIDDVPEEFLPFLNLLEVFLANRKDNDASRTFASILGNRPLKDAVYDLLQKTGKISEDSDRYLVLAGIPENFSKRLEEEAASQQAFGSFDGREDFTAITTFSIDDETTMDIDDALSLEYLDNGFRVGVHITDVSALVSQGDLLDDEALNRVTSIYLPDRTVNMFPKSISENLCSLVAGEDRAAMSFIVDFDEKFEQLDFSVKLSRVKIDSKLSYNRADELMQSEDGLGSSLNKLYEIADSLKAGRLERGAALFNRPELKITVDEGEPSVKVMDRNSPSRFLVSEFMILANSIAARFSARHDVPIIYRTQEKPEGLPEMDPDKYDPILFEQSIKCMKKSRLSLHPQSHGGLGADFYTQLTSPIRRYTDLVMQRQLGAYLKGEGLPYEAEELMAVIAAAESGNGEVKDVQRQAENYWLHLYMEKVYLGQTLAATVICKAPGGYIVELDEVFLRVKLALQDKRKNGERITVAIEKVKPRKGFMQLALVQD